MIIWRARRIYRPDWMSTIGITSPLQPVVRAGSSGSVCPNRNRTQPCKTGTMKTGVFRNRFINFHFWYRETIIMIIFDFESIQLIEKYLRLDIRSVSHPVGQTIGPSVGGRWLVSQSFERAFDWCGRYFGRSVELVGQPVGPSVGPSNPWLADQKNLTDLPIDRPKERLHRSRTTI